MPTRRTTTLRRRRSPSAQACPDVPWPRAGHLPPCPRALSHPSSWNRRYRGRPAVTAVGSIDIRSNRAKRLPLVEHAHHVPRDADADPSAKAHPIELEPLRARGILEGSRTRCSRVPRHRNRRSTGCTGACPGWRQRTGTPHGFRGSLAGCRGATRIPALAHKHAEPRRRRRPRSRTRARRPRLRPHPLASTRQRLRRRPRLENAHDSTVLPSLLCSFRSRYHRGRAVGAFASLDPVGLLQLSYVASDVCQLRGRHLRLRRHVSNDQWCARTPCQTARSKALSA